MKKYLIIIMALLVMTGCSLTNTIVVNGNSMLPALKDGDIVSYKNTNKFNRFDIVFFTYENNKLIKRIYGLPGENIIIDDGYIYINGEKLINDKYSVGNTTGNIHITLKDDEYFVLGDNREISKDSRHIGVIKRKDIRGVINV